MKKLLIVMLFFLSTLCWSEDCFKKCQLKYQLNQNMQLNLCDVQKKGKLAKQICMSKAHEKTDKIQKNCMSHCVIES
jgi:hypothetical protein